MKKMMLGFLGVAGMIGMANFAYANPQSIDLKATNGTAIHISWNAQNSFDENSGNNTETAQSVKVTLSNAPIAASQVVFIDNCTRMDGGGFQSTMKCDVQNGSCSLSGSVVMEQSYEGNDDRTDCKQQIAVVLADNTWLVDPISQQHNFNFTLFQ